MAGGTRMNAEKDLFITKGTSVQQLVQQILTAAVSRHASDIHVEPLDTVIRVRYRIDGVLCQAATLPLASLAKITACIKVMSKLDIANTRIPMDGRCRWQKDGRHVDLRVSTMPTVRGEKTVIRLLYSSAVPQDLQHLIPYAPSRQVLQQLVQSSQGLFLISGPTGSGKTTTLYAALREIDRETLSVATLEDPVELRVNGFCQSQINEKGGLGFQNGLRALLRQDPDVLVIGEIRDRETAEIAIRAALTGHRVFSTLHTSRAVDVPIRLLDMGIEPYLVADALLGMASQRLVRQRCPACRQGHDERYSAAAEPCPVCFGSGYSGRSCLCEVVPAGIHVRQAIRRQAGREAMVEAARSDGAVLMDECIRQAVESRLTDMAEIKRVYEE